MSSDFQTFCDTIMADLVANVSALSGAVQHKYAAWDPSDRTPDGSTHIAVWPAGDTPEIVVPWEMPPGDNIQQVYRVAYWEPGGTESERQAADEAAAANLLTLANAVRARFYVAALAVAGFWKITYGGVEFPSRSLRVRTFDIAINGFTGVART